MQYFHSFPYVFEICKKYFQVVKILHVKSNQTVSVTQLGKTIYEVALNA